MHCVPQHDCCFHTTPTLRAATLSLGGQRRPHVHCPGVRCGGDNSASLEEKSEEAYRDELVTWQARETLGGGKQGTQNTQCTDGMNSALGCHGRHGCNQSKHRRVGRFVLHVGQLLRNILQGLSACNGQLRWKRDLPLLEVIPEFWVVSFLHRGSIHTTPCVTRFHAEPGATMSSDMLWMAVQLSLLVSSFAVPVVSSSLLRKAHKPPSGRSRCIQYPMQPSVRA